MPREPEQIVTEIDARRSELAHSVETLRTSVGEAADKTKRAATRVPLIAAGAAATAFAVRLGLRLRGRR